MGTPIASFATNFLYFFKYILFRPVFALLDPLLCSVALESFNWPALIYIERCFIGLILWRLIESGERHLCMNVRTSLPPVAISRNKASSEYRDVIAIRVQLKPPASLSLSLSFSLSLPPSFSFLLLPFPSFSPFLPAFRKSAEIDSLWANGRAHGKWKLLLFLFFFKIYFQLIGTFVAVAVLIDRVFYYIVASMKLYLDGERERKVGNNHRRLLLGLSRLEIGPQDGGYEMDT